MNYSKFVFKGGCHVTGNKNPVCQEPFLIADAPAKVHICTAQHVGAPANILVARGDYVKMGQLICKANGFVSANIHSSVSGTVIGIEKSFLPDGRMAEYVVIENDGLDTLADCIDVKNKFDDSISGSEIIEKIKDSGIVGLGGAGFPTHIKYLPNPDNNLPQCIILNGIECEPYISDDHRMMLDYADKTINGLRYLMRAACCQKGYIAVEDNKQDAYELLCEKTREYPEIEIVLCKEKYPQGSEKQLVYSVTGKTVAPGALPISVGVIVNNVGTAVAVANCVENNMPLFERMVTVNGSGIKKPGNYIVRIGTPYSSLVDSIGGLADDVVKIINGGPMMGFAVPNLDFFTVKNTTALLFLTKKDLPDYLEERQCVRCSRCLDACPMLLEPTKLVFAVKRKNIETLKDYDLQSCLECGSCAYACPARIPLVQYLRLGKQYLVTDGLGAKNNDLMQ